MLLKENNPWLGLESYSINDAYRFYGRDNDIEIVSNAIYDNFITTIYDRYHINASCKYLYRQ